jgi:preprotein translocase subunit SecA
MVAKVFFESFERMTEFQQSESYRQVIDKTAVNILSEKTSKDVRAHIIKKAATAGRVTLVTKVFGRGTDFISRDTQLNDRGGTHIVQTFLSEMLSEEIQIQGRTARQGQEGSYSLVLLKEDALEEFETGGNEKRMMARRDTFAYFDIQPDELERKIDAGDVYQYLCQN